MADFILWSTSESLVRLFPDAARDTLQLLLRFQWTGISLIPAVVLYLALNFPYPSRFLAHRWAGPVVFIPSAAFIALIWTGDGLVTGMVVQTPLGPDAGTGPLYPMGVGIVILWLTLADVRMGRIVYRHRKEPEGRAATIVFFGLAHTHALGIGTDAILPVLMGTNVRSGLASIYLLDLSIFIAYAMYRYRILVIEPERELTFPTEPGFPLKEGFTQLVLCTSKGPAYGGFRALASRVPALCVTATPPMVITRRYRLDRTPILWLTKLRGQPRALKPSELKFEVLQTLGHALRQGPPLAILLDDLDYLALSVGFQDAAAFLKSLCDRCSGSGATLVVPLHPRSLEPRQVALLGQLLDHSEDLRHRPELPQVSGATSVLAVGSRPWGWSVLQKLGPLGRPLVVSPLHPAKYRALVGQETMDLLWLTEESAEGSVAPLDLDVGLARTVRRWMHDHPRSPVLLEGLEYLLTVNHPSEVVELVKGLVDTAAVEGNAIVFGLRGDTVDSQLLTLLALRCEVALHEAGPPKGL